MHTIRHLYQNYVNLHGTLSGVYYVIRRFPVYFMNIMYWSANEAMVCV